MTKETINAIYVVKKEGRDIKQLASAIAIGQTLGAWDELPGNLRLNISKHLAEVVSIEDSEYSATIKIAFPVDNFGSDLGALLTSLYGKISLASKIKLEDIEFTESYVNQFKGPVHGINKIREKINKASSPLLMSIFKPCLGISSSELAIMLETQIEAGIDFVKDDEILYDKDFSQTLKRLEACLKIKEKHNSKIIYAINLTGKADELLIRAKELEKNGADCILFNYVSYGLPLLSALRESISIPIMAHPAFAGAICQSAYSGLSEQLILGKLPRIAGADLVLFPSPYGSLAWDKNITREIHKSLQKPFYNLKPIWSVPSAGIKSSMIKEIISDFGENIVINAGTAVWSHSEGGKAGAKEFVNEIENLNLAIT